MPSLFPCSRCASSSGREQVVGRADRVDVAREVEVQVLHGDDLRVAAAGRAALDPEDRAERGLAQAEHRALADVPEPLGQRDRRRRLALARLRRRDRGDADQLPVGLVGEPLDHREVDLGLVACRRGRTRPARGRARSAISAIGSSVGPWAISRLLGICVAIGRLLVGPVRDGRGGQLGDERVGVEALERERLDQLGVSRVATSSASVVPTIGAALKP